MNTCSLRQMRHSFLFMFLTISLVLPACSGDVTKTSSSSGSSGSSSSSTGSSSGIVGPCVPWGTWKLTYDDANTPCALGSDTVTVTPNTDGTINVVFDGDDTMPMSMCSPNPEPGVYTTSGTTTADGCTVELTSSQSYCFSGESQCEKRKITLQINGDTASGTILHDVCWCTVGDPVAQPATAQRMP